MGYSNATLPKIPIVLDDVSCNGNEAFLSQCRNGGFENHNCNHFEDIVLDCRGDLILCLWYIAIVFSL